MKNKKIVFIRHAKSSWVHNVLDKERPLKQRGVKDATIISNEFNKTSHKIDFIYSSPANRAYSTCLIFKNALGWPEDKIKIVDDLYDFSGESVANFIRSFDDTLGTVAIFGHNYAFTSLINTMGDRYIDNLPTSGLAVINFNINHWKFAKYGQTELIMFPKDYRV